MRDHAFWRRQVTVSVILTAGLVGGVYAWEQGRKPPNAGGNFTIEMSDYRFTPGKMTWRVGERVTITLINASEANPPKPHEFMIGREPRTEETAFGIRFEDGYRKPFFDGVTIELVSGSGLKMLMAGGATFTGISPSSVIAPGPMGPMEAMSAFMPVLGKASRLTFSFTVPDKPGTWSYGCFQQTGQHFTNGMNGMITILPKAG